MKLTYYVLCLDDEINTLEEPKNYLSAFNNNVGIETKYTDIEVKIGPREDPDDFWMKIISKIEKAFAENTYDMILVDLHMGNLSGADIIHSIRENHTIYRPIIFYSAGDPEADEGAIKQLNEASSKSNLLGKSIFITSRNNLYNLASSILKEMHTEEHKVNRVRGLLMDRVSEFDAAVVQLVQNEQFLKLIPKGPARNKIVTEFKAYLKDDCTKAEVLLNQMKSLDITNIPNFLKDNPKDVSTYRKGYLLKSILKQIERAKPFARILSEGIDGGQSLRELRNEYGHTTAEQLDITHTDEKCINIRQEARRQLKNIDDIHECL
jgi:CheY-like chemotaxis protein